MKRLALRTAMVVACMGAFGISASISAQDGATLKGKFVFDGTPPVPENLDCSKEPACCREKMLSQALVVGKNKELANVVVYVRTTGLKVAPELASAQKEPVILDNKNCRFEPHVVGLVKGQKLTIGNSDQVGHNTNITAQGFNPIVPAGKQAGFEPKTVTLIPNQVSCNIHPWMTAWVLVRPDPFFAISAEDGSFEIKGLPADKELEFQVWQERAGFVTAVKVADKATTWQRGRFKQKLKAGANDLGEVKVAAKNFAK